MNYSNKTIKPHANKMYQWWYYHHYYLSGKRLIDYSSVIVHLLGCLPAQPIVTHVMADYELSLWQEFRQVLPQCKMSGCLFNFCLAIYRNIQLLGLVCRYLDHPVVNGIAKSIMALPLLRATDIIPTFQAIQTETQHIQQLHPFITYVQHQWIHRHFTPTDISLIRLWVRTNNDVEGWHHRLNKKGYRK